MEPIKAASIGLGWWGDTLATTAARDGHIDIATCFARTSETREAFAAAHDCDAAESFEAVLEDRTIDALLVATPHSSHLKIVEAAAAAGKHVFMEKPLALTVEEGRACVAAAEEAGVVLQVGHHRRRQLANRRLRRLVDDGALGVVHLLQATMHVAKYQDPTPGWRADPDESPAGAMTALGVHMIDTFQYLAGPIARVTSYSKQILGRWELDDATTVMFEFASGPLGTLATSLVLPRRCDVSIYGTELAGWSEEDGKRLFVQTKTESSRTEHPLELFDEIADQLGEFARCVRKGSRPETGGPEALDVVAVLQALVESTKSGRSVDVDSYRAT